MDGFQLALILGLLILLFAVMYLAIRIQRLHRHARRLRHLVKKLEGVNEDEAASYTDEEQMGD